MHAFYTRVLEYIFRHYIFVSKIGKPDKNILIQKIDAVGDYIICRNLFHEVVKSEKYAGYSFYLVVNERLRSLIEETDKAFYKEVIYADLNKLDKLKDRYNFYRRLRKLKFHTAIHSTFSRSFVTDETIFRSGAKYTIGFLGDTTNISAGHKHISDTYYSTLIDVNSEIGTFTHEFEKQKYFFETILEKKISIIKPALKLAGQINESNIVICPGAQHVSRTWSSQNFAALINLVSSQFSHFNFTIVCGPNEDAIAKSIIENCSSSPGIKVVHTNSIFNLSEEINKAHLVIANDSAPIHIAVALNKKAVCISNGNHYRRFVPYPGYIYSDLKVIFPPHFLKRMNDVDFINTYYTETSKLNINDISPETVLEECKNYLNRL